RVTASRHRDDDVRDRAAESTLTLVEVLAMIDSAILVKNMVRPLDGDRVVGPRARIERERRHDRLEVDEVDGKDGAPEHLADFRITESVAAADGLERPALVEREPGKVERDVVESVDPGGGEALAQSPALR